MGERVDAPAGILSLPQGGGSQAGIGAAFTADPFTGTGSISLGIDSPSGRHGLGPSLSLNYSTGTGNGPFGLGWSLNIGGVTRKTSLGIPVYDDSTDVFVLDGAGDLVPAETDAHGSGRYRPRTESDFALIDFDRAASRWTVRGKNGLTTVCDFPLASPANPAKVFSWLPTRVTDTFGNHVASEWSLDPQGQATQAYLDALRYIDYGDPARPGYLAEIRFVYTARPDPFSSRRAGFELRTSKRATAIEVWTGDPLALSMRYELTYDDSGTVALLTKATKTGHDGSATESLPPVEFGYSPFETSRRQFVRVKGELPPASLGNPSVELVDLFGCGLLDVVEISDATRYWRNLGDATFAPVRNSATTPGGYSLGAPGVQLLDADGDGRADLVITAPDGLAGYFPLASDGGWDARGFQRYPVAPSIDLKARDVRLVDLTGDGVTDAIRSGARFECFFNSPRQGWTGTRIIERSRLDGFPDVSFDDQRVQFADMTGDGLSDLVYIAGNSISYWPSLGYGSFGPRVTMAHAPQLPVNADPARLLVGDVDGDGCADLVYVGPDSITLWMNHGGNRWGDPMLVTGTPVPADAQGLRLVDFRGDGGAGVLWSQPPMATGDSTLFFLGLTGGRKPYLLDHIDNHLGATTSVEYRSSIVDYLRDQASPATRWRTTLPFPVHVVGSLTVAEHFSESVRTTSYEYHHGYWDGVEREFRGFGRVDQFDAAAGDDPVETRTWYHLGPVGSRLDWAVPRFTSEYWSTDPDALPWPPLPEVDAASRRDAARSLRGSAVRSEVYGRDGSVRQDRPYKVTELSYATTALQPRRGGHPGVFFPHEVAQRMTSWERGTDPLTQAQFTDHYDAFGQPGWNTVIAVAHGRAYRAPAAPGLPYLVSISTDEYAAARMDPYIADRTCLRTWHEVRNDGSLSLLALHDAILDGTAPMQLVAQQASYYDGEAFTGLELGVIGDHGAPVRTAQLTMTRDVLEAAYASDDGPTIPPYLVTGEPALWPPEYPDEFRRSLLPLAGYRYEDGSGRLHAGYWADKIQAGFDFQRGAAWPRGMTIASRDLAGNESATELDPYQLYTVAIRNPNELVSAFEHDYRVMSPRLITDANGNREQFGYSPLGDPAWHAVMGKAGERRGDTPEVPGTRWETDYFAFLRTGQPVSVTVTMREYHVNDTRVPPTERDRTLVAINYLDGRGRSLQTRVQGNDVRFGDDFGDQVLGVDQDVPAGPSAGRRHQGGDPVWVAVSGRTCYDAKGQVVRLYQPYLSAGWGYQPQPAAACVRSSYDPLGREVERINPDGTRRLTVYGIPRSVTDPREFDPSPWQSWFYDANDNASGPNPDAGTPTSVEVDAMGRPTRSVERLGQDRDAEVSTGYTYDIRSNITAVTDALGRIAFRYVYDQAGRALRTESIDAGVERVIRDATGLLAERRTSRGELDLHARDALARPLLDWARDSAAGSTTLRQELSYGDDPRSGLTREQARTRNCLGRLYLQRDEAGTCAFEAYDFKGNVAERVRRVTARGRAGEPGPRPWDDLDPAEYRVSTQVDALDRPVVITSPAGPDGVRRLVKLRYDRGGGLTAINLDGVEVVRHIAADVLGRMTLMALGNGVMSRWANNPRNQRVERVRSEPYTLAQTATELTYAPAGGPAFQDYRYGYDTIGNVTAVADRTPDSGTATDPGKLDRIFRYDPLYRLVSATGRETPPGAVTGPWLDPPRSGAAADAAAYTEKYELDACANLLRITHAGAAETTSRYTLAPGSNRLASYEIGTGAYTCEYDLSGDLLSDGPGRRFSYGMAGRLTGFTDAGVTEWHAYSASGDLVKTHRRGPDDTTEVSVYIDGFFEHRHDPDGEEAGIHVVDGGQRVATLWLDQAGPARLEYVLCDHLGSSNVVLDAAGAQLSREEYAPYGLTTFGGDPAKRYRFIGNRIDGVSGYYDFGARWYCPALARWPAPDPLGPVDEGNLFVFAGANPVSLRDPTGTSNGKKKALPPALPEPVVLMDPTQSDVVQLYRYLTNGEVKYYQNLADRLSCAIHVDSKLMDKSHPSRWSNMYPELEREVWNMFERNRGLHFGSNEGIRAGWEDAASAYSGGKLGGALYSALRTPTYANYLNQKSPLNLSSPVWLREPDVHHLLYKAMYPEFAVRPWNLMLTTRGSESSGLTGLHETIHLVSAAGQGNRWKNLVPATRALIESWTGQTASYYPSPPAREEFLCDPTSWHWSAHAEPLHTLEVEVPIWTAPSGGVKKGAVPKGGASGSKKLKTTSKKSK